MLQSGTSSSPSAFPGGWLNGKRRGHKESGCTGLRSCRWICGRTFSVGYEETEVDWPQTEEHNPDRGSDHSQLEAHWIAYRKPGERRRFSTCSASGSQLCRHWRSFIISNKSLKNKYCYQTSVLNTHQQPAVKWCTTFSTAIFHI